MNKEKNKKYFNLYIFLTTFARGLIEVFIGTLLFKMGFSLHQVIYYYVLVMFFSIIIGIPCLHFSKKYSNKLLSIIGIISLLLLQFVLSKITKEIYYLYIIAFLFALYRRAYWIARRYYTLQIVDDKKNVSKKYSTIAIINQLGAITASYIGALLLDYFDLSIINTISFILLGISTFCLYQLNFVDEKNNIKLDLIGTLKSIPKSSIIGIGCYELQVILSYIYPLFIIIYVKDTYTAVGGIYVITSLASLLFTYIYGRLINKDKNYLRLSILLFIIIKFLQINVSGILLIIVSLLVGFVTKMYDQSFQKEHILLSKKYELNNYNYAFEIIQNVFRFLVILFLFLFVSDTKDMLYITLIIMSISIFINFKNNKTKKIK